MKDQAVYVYGRQIELPMLIHVSRVRSHVASRVTWHAHQGFELLFLLDGATAYEFAGQQKVHLNGSHFLVVPPGLVHRGLHNVRSPCTICGLAFKASRPSAWKRTTFRPADLGRLRTALVNASQKAHPFNPTLRWLVRRMMEETANYHTNPHRTDAAIVLRALICAVLVEAMRQMLVPSSEPKEIAAAAVAFLQKGLSEPLSMDDLVRHLGFSRSRTFDVFKQQTGLTPNDYLLRLRVAKAQEHLSQTDHSVTDIALAAGFSSSQYFSTVFSRYTGVSPSAFRKGAKPRGRSGAQRALVPTV